MTTLSDAQRPHDSGVEPLRAKCGWIVALGVIYLIAGLIALSSVALATVASVFVVGIMMVIAGVAEVINGNRDYMFESPSQDFEGLANGLNVMLARLLGRPETDFAFIDC